VRTFNGPRRRRGPPEKSSEGGKKEKTLPVIEKQHKTRRRLTLQCGNTVLCGIKKPKKY